MSTPGQYLEGCAQPRHRALVRGCGGGRGKGEWGKGKGRREKEKGQRGKGAGGRGLKASGSKV